MKTYQQNKNYFVTGKTFNEIAAAVNAVNESLRLSDGTNPDNKIYQNGEIRIFYTGSTLPQFAAIALTGLAVKPDDDKFKYTTPTFTAGLVTEAKPGVPFAICAEPAKKNKFIKAVITGITPAKVSIKDTAHQYAKPTPGSSTGALESCEAGTARIIYSPGKTGQQWCILQLGAGGAGDEAYNGYFKIVNVSTTDSSGNVSNKIKIVDGATYSTESGTSGKSVCKVNNAVFQVDVFSADVSVGKTYCLKYTAATEEAGGIPAASAKVEIVELDEMPSDDKQTAYYQIGRTIVSGGSMKIQQDHKAGVAQIFWYLICSEDENEGQE